MIRVKAWIDDKENLYHWCLYLLGIPVWHYSRTYR